jgi:hypothetical protein
MVTSKVVSEILAGVTAQGRRGYFDYDRGAAQKVVGVPFDPSNRWRPYAVAITHEAMRRQPGIDFYVARLRAHHPLVLNYLHGGKV